MGGGEEGRVGGVRRRGGWEGLGGGAGVRRRGGMGGVMREGGRG